MQVILAMMVWMASLVVSSSYTATTLPDIKNKAFIENCVDSHNKHRSKVTPSAKNMLYMSWDPRLAYIAKGWAKRCLFDHNPKRNQHPDFPGVGENVWIGSVSAFSAQTAVESWNSEVQFYEYETNKCRDECGHYTQVVWADSYKVGCAVHFCTKAGGIPNAANFVCNYGPAGNFPTKPYKSGTWCSECKQNDTCQNNLCTNKERDQVKSFDPGRTIRPRNRYTSLILIVKSILLLLSVLITIWVKHKYPNLVLLK